MWTVTSIFDGTNPKEIPPEKTKLLKPGKEYTLGRRDNALNINLGKMSKNHGAFTVGEFTVDAAMDPTTRPTLSYFNKFKINSGLQRGEENIYINTGQAAEVQDGDILTVAGGVSIHVRWHPVCCYQPSTRTKSNTLLASCASFGIHIVHTPAPNITHHLTNSYAATSQQALSLVSACSFVKPEWLNEVIRFGNLPLNSDPSTGLSLEESFSLPPIAKFRPTLPTDLPAEHRSYKIWEPNEERMTLFSPFRFVCVGEAKRQIDSDLRELITRASGKIEVFDIQGGADKWRGTLTRAKAKTKQITVPLADAEACVAAVGEKSWKEIVEMTRVFGLSFFSHKDIIQAVLNTNVSSFSSEDDAPETAPAPSSSPLPSMIPNTHPDEGSLVPEPEPEPEPEVPPPPRKLTRRASSRQASEEPKPAEEPPTPGPRRHLTRRAQPTGQPLITGLDDPSILLDALPEISVAKPAASSETPAKPRSTRLKRRVGTSAPAESVEAMISNSIMSGIEPETGEEPPLKKFKALFDASDPRNNGVDSYVQESGMFDEDDLALMTNMGSQTQTEQTQGSKRTSRGGSKSAAALRAVPEEEEEETQQLGNAVPGDVGKKRKERSFDGDDAEMAGVEDVLKAPSGASSSNGPAAKKRAVEGNAVVPAAPAKPLPPAAQPSKTKVLGPSKANVPKTGNKEGSGAAAGKPDTDDAFLKAIASTKRGKKNEDDFDRDFNKLKISKSDLRGEETDHRPEWELLESFGDETNLRGNFMVIQDLDVFKVGNEQQPRRRSAAANPRWEGKPDFKKFKKTASTASVQKKLIELVISEENDAGGIGPAYWKGAKSSARDEEDFGFTQKRTQSAKRAASSSTKASQSKTTIQATIISDSDDDTPPAPKEKAKRSKPPSKAEPPKKRATRGASQAPAAPAALFLDDSDSDVQMKDAPQANDDDDLDAGQTLQSSVDAAPPTRRSVRPVTRRTVPIAVNDDDSDDGAVFTGFGQRGSRR
ncbi:putative proline-rich protein [Favolaschia claudopus]|uniref:Proline-rich protein n=1 Tax=Favolaschia claudopus TaxID=2862362 RepID=A0AAW0DBI5_9AGAR